MGRNSVRFRCVSCGHCCRDVVCLPTPWDVVQIVKETGENPYEFLEFLTPKEISLVKKSDPWWLEVDGHRFLMAIKRNRRGCYFLDAGLVKCKIYETRPLVCRLFPFSLRETQDGDYISCSLHRNIGCPRRQDGELPTPPLYALYNQDRDHQQDYEDLVKVFNRRKAEARAPEEFIRLFYQRNG